jgi:hypothetical protein
MNWFSTVILVLVSPYLLSFVQVVPDTSYTEIGLAVGTGSYAEVTRDCSGNVTNVRDIPIREAAVSVDYYSHVVHFGLRSGVVGGEAGAKVFGEYGQWDYQAPNPQQMGSLYYVTPLVGLNSTYFGVDLGYVFPLQETREGMPAGTLWIGNKNELHFRAHLADQIPLITGGTGLGSVGLEWDLGKPRQFMWIGVGALPYDGLLVGTHVELPVSEAVLLRFAGSVGTGEASEYGLSLGTRLRF